MTIATRKPSGKPSWPITLAAGMQSSGKSWLAAVASGSPLVSRTLWVGYGEKDPDEYGAVPGADFEIVAHDGTVADVVSVLDEIAAIPTPAEGPILIVLDSATRIWDTLAETAQNMANARYATTHGGKEAEGPVDIGVDIWNVVKADWQAILGALRRHQGPSIVTARFEEVTQIVNGEATGARIWRVKAEKGLPYDVDAVIEMRARGDYTLTKVRSTRLILDGEKPWPEFTMDALWREMGLGDGDAGTSHYAQPVPVTTTTVAEPEFRDWLAELARATSTEAVRAIGAAAQQVRAPRPVLAAVRTKLATLEASTAASATLEASTAASAAVSAFP